MARYFEIESWAGLRLNDKTKYDGTAAVTEPKGETVYAELYHAEPEIAETTVSPATIDGRVILPATSSLTVEDRADELLRALVPGSEGYLYLIEKPTNRRVRYWAAVEDRVSLSEFSENVWDVAWGARSWPEATVPTTVMDETVNPSFQLFANPNFEGWSQGEPNDTITDWGVGRTGTTSSVQVVGQGLDGFCVRLVGGDGTAYIEQSETMANASAYRVTVYVSGGTPTIKQAGVLQSEVLTGSQVEGAVRTWQRYYAELIGDGTSQAIRFEALAGQTLFICFPMLSAGATTRNFQYKDTAGYEWEYKLITTGGKVRSRPRIKVTTNVVPHGRWTHKVGPLEAKAGRNSENEPVRYRGPLRLTYTGALNEVNAVPSRLRADGNDLEVALLDGRGRVVQVMPRWIEGATTGALTDTDWVITFDGLNLGEGARQFYLLHGNSSAPAPSRLETPTGLTLAGSREPADEDPNKPGKQQYELVANKDYYVWASAHSEFAGETLAAGPIRLRWRTNWNARVACDDQPNADSYCWYLGTSNDAAKARRVGTSTKPSFVITGKPAPRNAPAPRTTGSNPNTPYDRAKPLPAIRTSNQTRRYYTQFIDTRDGYEDRPGTWTTRNASSAVTYAQKDGLTSYRNGREIGAGDYWQIGPDALGGVIGITRVQGQMRVRLHPEYRSVRLMGQRANGQWVQLYKAGGVLGMPDCTVIRRAGASSLAAKPHRIRLTNYNGTGETSAKYEEPVEITSANNQVIRVALDEAGDTSVTGHYLYCAAGSQQLRRVITSGAIEFLKSDGTANTGWAHNTTTGAITKGTGVYPVVMVVKNAGTGQAFDIRGDALDVYPSLTQLPAFDTGTLTEPVYRMRLQLDQLKPYNRPQEVRIDYLDLTLSGSEAPSVAGANSTNVTEMGHHELAMENRTLRQGIQVDLIDLSAGDWLMLDADTKQAFDSRGLPQRDSLRFNTLREQWIEQAPGRPNVWRFGERRRSGATNAPDMSVNITLRERG
ncbi:MAG: hypothetical protein M3P51_09120 [Chloroflexota bacterium]|nr:hypothetical protein [Chloroflexota bacterium]